jgi:hypothetical protein
MQVLYKLLQPLLFGRNRKTKERETKDKIEILLRSKSEHVFIVATSHESVSYIHTSQFMKQTVSYVSVVRHNLNQSGTTGMQTTNYNYTSKLGEGTERHNQGKYSCIHSAMWKG